MGCCARHSPPLEKFVMGGWVNFLYSFRQRSSSSTHRPIGDNDINTTTEAQAWAARKPSSRHKPEQVCCQRRRARGFQTPIHLFRSVTVHRCNNNHAQPRRQTSKRSSPHVEFRLLPLYDTGNNISSLWAFVVILALLGLRLRLQKIVRCFPAWLGWFHSFAASVERA